MLVRVLPQVSLPVGKLFQKLFLLLRRFPIGISGVSFGEVAFVLVLRRLIIATNYTVFRQHTPIRNEVIAGRQRVLGHCVC